MTILERVARAVAMADLSPADVTWEALSADQRRRYECMAAAGLAVRIVVEGLDPYGLNGPPRG